MPHEAKGFQCDFCPRMFGSLVDAVKHEDDCKFNPARRSCFTCKNGGLMNDAEWYGFDDQEGEHRIGCNMRQYFGCKHFGNPITDDMESILCDTDNDGINPALPRPGTCAWWEWDGDRE